MTRGAVYVPYDAEILEEVSDRRVDQQHKWGEQHHPLGQFVASGNQERSMVAHLKLLETLAKKTTDMAAQQGEVTWHEILNEELCEAAAADTLEELVNELIDVAAVCVAMVRDIRKSAKEAEPATQVE